MQADVIHLLQDGQVVESGSHAQLLARGGRYAQAWWAQLRTDGRSNGSSSRRSPMRLTVT